MPSMPLKQKRKNNTGAADSHPICGACVLTFLLFPAVKIDKMVDSIQDIPEVLPGSQII